MSELDRWRHAAAEHDVSVAQAAGGVLVTLDRFNSRYLAVRYGAFEQLSATLAPGYGAEPAPLRDAVATALLRAHVFTLGARAGIDRAGGLAVVAEAEAPVPDAGLVPWLMRTQVVANAMLAIVTVARETGEALEHDAIARLFAARQ